MGYLDPVFHRRPVRWNACGSTASRTGEPGADRAVFFDLTKPSTEANGAVARLGLLYQAGLRHRYAGAARRVRAARGDARENEPEP
jgi:hypothetical protein